MRHRVRNWFLGKYNQGNFQVFFFFFFEIGVRYWPSCPLFTLTLVFTLILLPKIMGSDPLF